MSTKNFTNLGLLFRLICYTVIVALLTSVEKKPYPFQYKFTLNGRSNTAMFDQIMTVSKENLESKLGELTPQQIYESDMALMCSLNLLQYSMTSMQNFDIISIVTERTKAGENIYCNIDIISILGDKENRRSGRIDLSDLLVFDTSITKDTEIDEIKTKLNSCAGINFIANHIQF